MIWAPLKKIDLAKYYLFIQLGLKKLFWALTKILFLAKFFYVLFHY